MGLRNVVLHAVLKRETLCKSECLKLINGLTIKEVDDEGYKYLGILELYKFKERELKGIFRTEYFKVVVMVRTRSKQQTLRLCHS